MQTVLIVRPAVAGMVCLNGRMAGEADGDHPLSLPVSPNGAHLLELRPFLPGYLPLTVRLPLSGGIPVLRERDARLFAAVWPGGMLEAELIPQMLPVCRLPQPVARQSDASYYFLDSPGEAPALLCESPAGSFAWTLPEGALFPAMTALPSGPLFLGGLKDGGQYAAASGGHPPALQLCLTGAHISLLEDGSGLRALRSFGDSAGHASLETWTCTPQGWQRTNAEPMWEYGAPRRPDTPESTAVAAVEAAQLGLSGEAAAWFAPAVPCAEALRRAAEYDGCVPLRCPLPDGRPAVGLMRMTEHVLRIVPAYYTAVPGPSAGSWLLTGLEIDEDA